MPGSRKDFKRNNALIFTLRLIWSCHSTRSPAPGVMKISILVDPSLVIITTYCVSDLYLGEEKKNFKGIMQFHFKTYIAMPEHKNPCPTGLEMYNFGRPFLGHHYNILGFFSTPRHRSENQVCSNDD